jgi:DNA-binding Lrp family transcriptional regulator
MAGERLDRTDRALVAALQKNARVSNKDLATLVGLAPSTCLERVRALRARGVIRGFHAEVDHAALGRSLEAIVAVRRPHSRANVVLGILPRSRGDRGLPASGQRLLVHVGLPDMTGSDFVLDRLMYGQVAHVENI